MAYPDFIVRFGNHSEDKYDGNEFDVEKLDRDLNILYPAVNEINRIIRNLANADGSLAPADPDRENDIVTTQTFDGADPTLVYPLINTIDSTVTLIGNVLVNGVLQFETTDYTYDNDNITFVVAPPVGTDNVSYQTFMNMAGVIDALKSVTYQEGGYMVGYPDQLSLYNALTVGDALDEIRLLHDAHELEYGAASQYLKADGSVPLTFDWEVNEREAGGTAFPAVGTVTIISTVLDTTTVTIDDAIVPGGVTFEFNLLATAPAPGNVKVLIGGTDNDTIDNFVAAIGASQLNISPVNSGGGVASLTHQIASAIGNRAITTSDAAVFTVIGMLNGQNGILGDLRNRFRIRNMAPSLQDGDAVVHEQLQGLLNVIENFSDLFFRIDGTSTMSGNANIGGNKLQNVADGTEPTDGINLSQLDLAEAKFNLFIPAAGATSVDYSAQSTITGALSMGQGATASADAIQDSGAVVHTWHGIARPTQPDQVANKQFVDEVEASLQVQINAIDTGAGNDGLQPNGTVNIGSGLSGCVLDGTGLGVPVADINIGGIYNFDDLTIGAAQTPADHTSIFADGSIVIQNNITNAAARLEISASGDITISNASTITVQSLVLRAGGIVTIDGVIVADGGVVLPTAANGLGAGRGLAGFVSVIAGGACNMANTGAITTGVCNIQAGADSVMAGTVTARIKDAKGFGGIVGAGELGYRGSMFGRECGFLAAGLSFTYKAGDANNIDANYAYIPAIYAGEPGKPSLTGDANGSGSGGGGGTSGGAGSNPANAPSGGTAFGKGMYRTYLYPRHPGGGGGGAKGDFTFAGALGGQPGGAIIVYVNGDLTLTGALFTANGASGTGGGGTFGKAAGGGGSIRVVANGEIFDGTLSATGGNSVASGSWGGGAGGGGGAFFVALSYGGGQTLTVTGGSAAGTGGGASGTGVAGDKASITLSPTEMDCLTSEGYWSR